MLNESLLRQLESQAETGFVSVIVSTALGALPVPGAVITLYRSDSQGNEEALYHVITDRSGRVPNLPLPVTYNPESPLGSSEYFFSTYNLRVQANGYYTQNIIDVRVFPDTITRFNVNLIPISQGGDEGERTIVIPPSPTDFSKL